MKQVGDLQIEHNFAQQKREWRFERIGWVIMSIILLAALLGFLGEGLLSHKSTGDSFTKMQIEYYNIERLETPMTISIYLNNIESTGKMVKLSVSRDYLSRMRVNSILPEPDKTEIDGMFYNYIFNSPKEKTNSLIQFELEPDRIGIANGVFKLNDIEQKISQVILP
ncbi:MAG TPA: hypothetical protein VFF33_14510 [Ignavibacteriaceae bacterium]|nr:hypothetical protein [Ignavibacteriaceae bacterium]